MMKLTSIGGEAASVVMLLLVLATVVVRTQDVTFSSRIEAVRVDVLVTDNGQPVRGLGPADFEIRDNGVVQQIDLVSFDQVPLNAVLALDMSDSVAGERLDRLRAAGNAVLAGLKSALSVSSGVKSGTLCSAPPQEFHAS